MRLFLVDAESAAKAHQQDHGGDSPNDAEHGQENPHFVRPECGERLPQKFAQVHRGLQKNQASGFRPWALALPPGER